MKKSSKIGLGIGTAMCVTGLILFGVGMSSGGGEYVMASDKMCIRDREKGGTDKNRKCFCQS